MGNKTINIHLELVDRCRKGDTRAQFEIYSLYYRPMYNSSLRIVGKADIAEDIMQESFLIAFRKLGSYRGEADFGVWLKRIAINRSLDYLRKKKKFFEVFNDNLPDTVDEDEEPELLSAEEVKAAIAVLPDGYRTVLSLVLIEGLSHEEVAQMLGIRNVSSRTQFSRARQRLKEVLSERRNNKLLEETYDKMGYKSF